MRRRALDGARQAPVALPAQSTPLHRSPFASHSAADGTAAARVGAAKALEQRWVPRSCGARVAAPVEAAGRSRNRGWTCRFLLNGQRAPDPSGGKVAFCHARDIPQAFYVNV